VPLKLAGNELLTPGAGQLILCDIHATFTLWFCRTGTGSIQVGSSERAAKKHVSRLIRPGRKTMTESAAPTLTEVTTLAGTAHANASYPPDAP
jgi:hypothetical protein